MRGDRFRLIAFFFLSACVHAGLGLASRTIFAAGAFPAPGREVEVILEPPAPEPRRAPPSPVRQDKRRKATASVGRVGERGGPGGAVPAPSRASSSSGLLRRVARSGGSPAPAPFPGGRDGATGPEMPPEDILYSGGGAGGAHRPDVAPRRGSGGGLSVQTAENPLAETVVPETRAGAGPGAGGGQGTDVGGGLGFVPDSGVGTRPDGRETLATRQRAEGEGLGAATGDETGTRAPGGGAGTGSDLPGTGGAGGGYGRESGDGLGSAGENGSGGSGGDGASGRPGRGAVFGVSPPPGAHAEDGAMCIVYLVDVSLSMERGNKIGAARQALKQAIGELKPTDALTVIAFDKETHALSPDLLPATAANLRRALDFVDALQLDEGTNLDAALDRAFSTDTPLTHLFVLSDGEPTVGETNGKKIRARTRERNRRHAQILTLALGQGERFPGIPLLRDLARENNGVFRYISLPRQNSSQETAPPAPH